MRQAQINVRTRVCSRTSIARTKQAALTHNVRGKELIKLARSLPCVPAFVVDGTVPAFMAFCIALVCDLTQRCKDTCLRLWKQFLRSKKTSVTRNSACSTPAFSRRLS